MRILRALTTALAASLLLAACGTPSGPAAVRAVGQLSAASRADAGWVVTAASVEAINGRVDRVSPPVFTPVGAAALLTPASCLGGAGPLGAYGPLGTLGPIGTPGAFDASRWMDLAGHWDGLAKQLTQRGGPLSAQGPLGPSGPLGDTYTTVMPRISGFAAHLAAGGLWTALGPVGPLGALGPLGPLGPLGAHGFKRDGFGRYTTKDGQVQRSVEVPWHGAPRRYELVERYPADSAALMTDNDTSCMIEGAIDTRDEADAFKLASAEAQVVTFVLLPEKQLDDFDLAIHDGQGKLVATSDSRGLIDFVQLQARAGERFEARVTRRSHAHVLRADYRLVVTGAGAHLPEPTIRGPHQQPRG